MQLNQAIDWLQGPRAVQTARAVALVLGLWVLYQLALLVWQLIPAPELPEVAMEPEPAQPAPNARRQRVDISQVVNWHLFGAPSAAPATAASGPIDAPETRLNLILRGVLSSHDPENARAIIAEPNGNENFFKIGSALPGGAELTEIYADRIILMRAGRHETLRLPKEGLEGAVNSAPGARRGANAEAANIAPVQGIEPSDNAGELLGHYRDQVADNPRALLDLARPVPFNDANGFAGFRLFPGNNPALFEQLGLQPGDLVKEVNGIALDNPMRGAEVIQGLRESGQLSMRIMRGGQEINLAVSIP